MEVLVRRAAGLDVHRSVIVACAVLTRSDGRLAKERGQFQATAAGLARLAEWLRGHGVSHVGMESTGVYWMPVYGVLEQAGGFELIVANAQHVKQVPGRKTDVSDAEWLAQWDCQEFRVWPGIMGTKETSHGPRQSACDS